MRRHRKLLALLCIAVVAMAILAPSDGSGGIHFSLTPVWLEFQPEPVVVFTLDASASSEQPVSLLSLAALRAPPAASPI